jgi:hypothetical protein
VRQLIAILFPDLPQERAAPGEKGHYQATGVRALLDILDDIPDHLIRLPGEDWAFYKANISALQSGWDDRNVASNAVFISPLARQPYRPIYVIDQLLARCPDEAAPSKIIGLEFISDVALRESLLTDISAATSALANHEYKAATVLAGATVEALLLWALQETGEATIRGLTSSAAARPLEEWTLGQIIAAASACGLITGDTKKQAELAQNFRNLIHPGRQLRLRDKCDRGTAYGALAAVERVGTDLASKFSNP